MVSLTWRTVTFLDSSLGAQAPRLAGAQGYAAAARRASRHARRLSRNQRRCREQGAIEELDPISERSPRFVQRMGLAHSPWRPGRKE